MFYSIRIHQSEIDLWYFRCCSAKWSRCDVAIQCNCKCDDLLITACGFNELLDRRWTGDCRAHVVQCTGYGNTRPTSTARKVPGTGCEQRGADEHQRRLEPDHDFGSCFSCHSIFLSAVWHLLKCASGFHFVNDDRVNDLLYDRWVFALDIL